MYENQVKTALRHGRASIGTFVFEFDSTGIARIAADAGAEFAIFDMEHTGWSVETIRRLIATSRAAEIVPIVRVPVTEYHFIARVLDVGARGIMVPMVGSAEQARAIVQSAKYPPTGRRGAAFSVSHDDYTGGDILAKMRDANDQHLLIAQIETAQGVKSVEEIAAVEGIDVLWIGHFDLTNSMGIPGQFSHPDFHAAVKCVVEACQRHNKIAGFMAADVETGKSLLSQGFRMLAYGGDIWLYQQALRHGVTALREAASQH
jgi:2-dehydro-3-deoxyglucarate aldolase/4-hydroxy-2-oxoheptanedioate aldolase